MPRDLPTPEFAMCSTAKEPFPWDQGLALFSGSVTANVGARGKGERLCCLLFFAAAVLPLLQHLLTFYGFIPKEGSQEDWALLAL